MDRRERETTMRWLRKTRSLLTVTTLVPTVAVVAALAVPASTATATPVRPANAAILPPPPGDAFYTPPSPLPAGKPGDIIWFRSATSPVPNAAAWQVLYLSTTALGAPAAVSGTLIVPAAPVTGTRPVVGYAAGTQGWGD